jgi:hypothetical protein
MYSLASTEKGVALTKEEYKPEARCKMYIPMIHAIFLSAFNTPSFSFECTHSFGLAFELEQDKDTRIKKYVTMIYVAVLQ